MELIRSTDYFAAIPLVPHFHGVDQSELNLQPVTELSPNVQALRQRAVAEIAFIALLVATAIVVATVVFSWSL